MASPVTYHKIVALETFWTPMPTFELPPGYTFEITEYSRSTIEQVPERIKHATILVVTNLPLSAHCLSEEVCPDLKMIAIMASGTDSLDLATCQRRGIAVSSCKGANIASVSESALSMCFAARRMFGVAQLSMRSNDWVEKKPVLISFKDAEGHGPPTWEEETLGIIGYGDVGKRIQTIASMLGMKVLVSDRKQASVITEGRTPFTEVIKQATLIVCSVPLGPDTVDLISTTEFGMMRPNAIVINVSRGGIINEEALLAALETKQIYGAGVDVWQPEPAGPTTTPLLRKGTEGLNLIATPHTAWHAEKTFKNYQSFLRENVYAWCAGSPTRVVV